MEHNTCRLNVNILNIVILIFVDNAVIAAVCTLGGTCMVVLLIAGLVLLLLKLKILSGTCTSTSSCKQNNCWLLLVMSASLLLS